MHVHSSWHGAFRSCEEALPKCLRAQPKALAHFFQAGSCVYCCPEMSLPGDEVIMPHRVRPLQVKKARGSRAFASQWASCRSSVYFIKTTYEQLDTQPETIDVWCFQSYLGNWHFTCFPHRKTEWIILHLFSLSLKQKWMEIIISYILPVFTKQFRKVVFYVDYSDVANFFSFYSRTAFQQKHFWKSLSPSLQFKD